MKRHTLTTLAALLLAGSLSAAQAQTTTPGAPVQPSTEASPTTPPTHPTGDPTPGAAQQDEAGAIQAAREKCKSAGGPPEQEACMSKAQQEYQRSKSGGSMKPQGSGAAGSSDGSMKPDSGSGSGSSGSSGSSTGSGSSGQSR